MGAFVAGILALVAIAAMPSAGDSAESAVAHTVTRSSVTNTVRGAQRIIWSTGGHTQTLVKRVASAGPVRERRARTAAQVAAVCIVALRLSVGSRRRSWAAWAALAPVAPEPRSVPPARGPPLL